MKHPTKISALMLVGLLALTTACTKDHVTPEFEMENAPYTAQYSFKTKSQDITKNAAGQNIIKVVIEGTGTSSFAGNVTFTDAFDFILATGAADHKVTFTTTNGDTFSTTMTTQVGPSSITGTTTFTGGTGRFAKIKGSSPNVGPPVGPTGEGTWKEEDGKVTF
ncbi:hypothetical protein [Persicitalea sp.]|uniref:hypothetical protein n=1 Tax=Persicitalea sp. TaxID=3100273 RepID=UPI00359353ED